MNDASTKKPSETDWARLEAMKDEDIDFSDIPELTAEWFAKAKMINVPGKTPVFVGRHPDDMEKPKLPTVELAPDVAAAFKTADEVNEALRVVLRAAQRLQENPKTEPIAKAS